MLEATDFPQALRDSKHNARQIMARCNWNGAERRAPLNVWSDGLSKMEPGAEYPGRDARTHTAGKDMNTGFLVLDREANDELVKAIDQGRQELQQEQDAALGPRAHPKQLPPPPQPGNSHAGPSGAKDNAGDDQPNNGQDRSQNGKSTSTPMDTSGTTAHCSVPANATDKVSSKGPTKVFDMSATDVEEPPQPQASEDELSHEPLLQNPTHEAEGAKKKKHPKPKMGSNKPGQPSGDCSKDSLPDTHYASLPKETSQQCQQLISP